MPTVVITGATRGLGRIAAVELARRGARLVLTARNPSRARDTVAEIRATTPTARVEVIPVDLSAMGDVARAGAAITAAHPSIDALVNNAGLHAFRQRVTDDGLPEMMAVNYLAPWLLTHTLLPSLTRTPGSRVISVASEASRRHGTLTLPHDLTDTTPFTARESSPVYGRSKLLDIMFSLELARRLRDTPTSANCLDPGFNVTGLGRELRGAAALERTLRALRIGDPRRGAGLIVRLATDPAFAGVSGGYYTVRHDRALIPAAPADDQDARARLWDQTEELLRPHLRPSTATPANQAPPARTPPGRRPSA
ncbi:SDR family NAD(P)-dependent oxidoreductase [Promicromonospora sp. MS192]|uniref:SDR family NAD(P)-dependent oxidoreductase n=1 Tax=Promicromonospora sp. MS192 TaxID=3412684 RepID=UPI003C2CAD5F